MPAENLTTVRAVAEALATLLGGMVRKPYDHEYYQIVCAGGLSLGVNQSSGEQKAHIYTQWPTDLAGKTCNQYGDDSVSANFGLTKSAEKIAQEASRRVVEPYRPILARSMELVAQHNDYFQRTTDVAEQYRAAGYPVKDAGIGQEPRFYGPGSTVIRLSPDQARIDNHLSCSHEKMMRILAILAE